MTMRRHPTDRDWQGKRAEQVADSGRMFAWASALLVLACLVLLAIDTARSIL